MKKPEIADHLPVGDPMLQVMAEVIGDELLERLAGGGSEQWEPPGDTAASIDFAVCNRLALRS
jgi:hypothetical protein